MLGPFDNLLDEAEVQKGLAALKLDLDLWGWRPEDELERLRCRLRRHVESTLVGALPRNLAVRAGVLATQRDHEHVERCEAGQPPITGACLQRQQLERQLLANLANEMLAAKPAQRDRVLRERLVDQQLKLVGREKVMFADHVRDQHP